MNLKRLELLKEFLLEKPNDPFLKYALAKEYEKGGEEQTALAILEALTDEHPDYVGTYYHLGKIYEGKGDFEKAVLIYEEGMIAAKKAGDQHALGELAGAKLAIDDGT